MFGFFPIGSAAITDLIAYQYSDNVTVINPPVANYFDGRKPYIIDGNKVYLNKDELNRALDVLNQPEPEPVQEAPEIQIEDAEAYRKRENELASYLAAQAEIMALQAEAQRKAAMMAAIEAQVLAKAIEKRRQDEELSLLLLL